MIFLNIQNIREAADWNKILKALRLFLEFLLITYWSQPNPKAKTKTKNPFQKSVHGKQLSTEEGVKTFVQNCRWVSDKKCNKFALFRPVCPLLPRLSPFQQPCNDSDDIGGKRPQHPHLENKKRSWNGIHKDLSWLTAFTLLIVDNIWRTNDMFCNE